MRGCMGHMASIGATRSLCLLRRKPACACSHALAWGGQHPPGLRGSSRRLWGVGGVPALPCSFAWTARCYAACSHACIFEHTGSPWDACSVPTRCPPAFAPLSCWNGSRRHRGPCSPPVGLVQLHLHRGLSQTQSTSACPSGSRLLFGPGPCAPPAYSPWTARGPHHTSICSVGFAIYGRYIACGPHTPHPTHTYTYMFTHLHTCTRNHASRGLAICGPCNACGPHDTHTHHIHKHTYKHTHTTHTYTYVFTHVRTCTRNHASHGRRRYSHVPRNHLRRTLANARVRINTLQLSDDVLAGVSRAIMGRLDIVDLVGRNTADEFAERVGRCALWGALLQAPTLAHAWPHVCRGLSPPWTLLPTPLLAAPCLHFVPRALCLPLPQQLCGSECQKVFSVVGVAPLFTNNTHLLFILTPADTRGPAGPGN